MKEKSAAEEIRKDAKPQYVRTRKGAKNSGEASTEPRVAILENRDFAPVDGYKMRF